MEVLICGSFELKQLFKLEFWHRVNASRPSIAILILQHIRTYANFMHYAGNIFYFNANISNTLHHNNLEWYLDKKKVSGKHCCYDAAITIGKPSAMCNNSTSVIKRPAAICVTISIMHKKECTSRCLRI